MRRWLPKRRLVQLGVLGLLFVQSSRTSQVMGNLNSIDILGMELSNPFTVIQAALASRQIYIPLLISSSLVLAFYLIMGGRVFCSWVCPLHLILEYTDKIRNRIKASEKSFNGSIRYWILSLVIFMSLSTGIPLFEILSPLDMVTRLILFGSWIGSIGIGAIVLFEIFYSKRAWCRYLCPLGAFYALVGWLSLVRMRIDHSKCTSCMRCKEVCLVPHVLEGAIRGKSEVILSGDCTNCCACVDRCQQGALRLGLRFQARERRSCDVNI